jgi:tetratricopeptide (TPR) repeat protein
MRDERVDLPAGPCPGAETLAAYVDGRLPANERAAVEAHLARCERCFELVTELGLAREEIAELRAETIAAVAQKPAATTAFTLKRRSPIVLAAAAAVVLAVSVGLMWWRQIERERANPRGRLVAALGESRVIEPRLTGGFRYGPLVAQTRSSARENLSLLAAAGELQKEAEANATATTLQAWGVAQLLIGEYDAAVQTLSRAASLAADNAEIQTDLSAAYLARAANLGRADDWARGLAVAERAIALDSHVREAWYNRALALDAMNLRAQAQAAWRAYLERDADSPWAGEARRALERRKTSRLSDWDATIARARRGEVPARGLVEISVQFARELGEQRVLSEWSAAVAKGDETSARAALDFAGELGREIAAAGGDRTLDAQVRYLRALDPGSRSMAVVAHVEWSRALEHLNASRWIDAIPLLERTADHMKRAGAPIATRVEAQLASAARAVRRFDVTRRAAASAVGDPEGCSASDAESRRALALVGVAEGDYNRALAEYEASAAAYARCRETANEASVHALIAELLTILGAFDRAWQHEMNALAHLDDLTHIRSRLLVTYCGSELALRQGLPEAALHLSREAAAMARAAGHLPGASEAAMNVAKALVALSRDDEAERTMTDALQLLRQDGNAWHQQFVEGELLIALARLRSRTAPADSGEIVGAALRHARAVQRSAHLPALLFARARYHLARNDVDLARADLREGIEAFLGQLEAAGDAWLKLSFRQSGWDLYEELAKLELDSGAGSAAALGLLLEGQARVSHARAGGRARTLAEIQAALEPRTAAVFVHAFDDRVATWVIGPSAIAYHSARAGWSSVDRLTRDLTVALQLRQSTRAREVAARAYELTLAPHEAALAHVDRIRLLCTAPLDQLAWASLRSKDGAFLIESKTIEFARAGVESGLRPVRLDAPTVVLAAPGGGSGARLALVRDEAQTIAALRPNVRIVDGSSTSRDDVIAALGDARVLHYAGHAVSDPEAPERSALLLRSTDPITRLTARDLAALHTQIDLAILTACQAGADPAARSAGSASLAAVLRDAGIGAVIAAVGDVDDADARAMGIGIHQELARGHDAASALRLAQLARAKASGDGQWALFVILS